MALAPAQARRRLPDGAIEVVAAEELHPGDIILLRPGERLASDGIVETGSSAVDQSSVTGESTSVEVARGSQVFGGTLNGNGPLEIRVSKEHADTVLARVFHQVEQAQASKGSAQRFTDRFSAVYTPAMFALAILLSILPPLSGADFRDWFYRALVVLTVSCSCGLVISVPVAVVAAISRAARDGILIKGGAYLEALGSVRTVALDKTGTLTRGHPRLTDAIPLREDDAGDILRLAGISSARESLHGRRLDEPECRVSACCALPSGITEPQLSEVARMGVQLSSLDNRFDAPVRELGTILGRRLAAQSSDHPSLALSDALQRLRHAFRQHGFVDCEFIGPTAEDTELRLGRCQEALGWEVPNVGRSLCSFDEGLVEGFLRVATGDESLAVRENACMGEGQTSCQLLVTCSVSGSLGHNKEDRVRRS